MIIAADMSFFLLSQFSPLEPRNWMMVTNSTSTKQHHGHGTCVAVLRRVDEGYVVDVVNKGHGRIAGAALGDHVHLVIHLEGGDGQHDDNEEGGRLQLGQSDVPELLPAVCTVQLGGFVQVRVGALQTGQVDDHVIAHVLPDAEQDDREHSGVLTGSQRGRFPPPRQRTGSGSY